MLEEYPKVKYCDSGESCTVKSFDEEMALIGEWGEHPDGPFESIADASEPDEPNPGEEQPAPVPPSRLQDVTPSRLQAMTKDELISLASQYHIEMDESNTKNELVAAILNTSQV